MSDLYPNTNPLADTPDEIDKEMQEEKSMTLTSMPLLPDLITRLDDRIKELNSIDSLNITERSVMSEVQIQILVNKEVKRVLEEEKERLEQLFDTYSQ